MKDLKEILATVLMICVVSTSAFAVDPQKKDEKQSPPPKEPRVIDKAEKKDGRGGDNDQRGGGKGRDDDRRGKP